MIETLNRYHLILPHDIPDRMPALMERLRSMQPFDPAPIEVIYREEDGRLWVVGTDENIIRYLASPTVAATVSVINMPDECPADWGS